MTEKELFALKDEAKPLDEAELRTLKTVVKKLKMEPTEQTLPIETVLLFLRHTFALNKDLSKNSRRKRIKSVVLLYTRMMNDHEWVSSRMVFIRINADDCTVPDGVTRLMSNFLHGQPIAYFYQLVTKEEAELMNVIEGLGKERSIGDRLQQLMGHKEVTVAADMNKWNPALKYLNYADRKKYVSSTPITIAEYLETFAKHEKGMRWLIETYRAPKAGYNRSQVHAAFVYMHEQNPKKAQEFMAAFMTCNTGVEVPVEAAAILYNWFGNAENIRPANKQGQALRGWGALEERVFFTCAYCMAAYLNDMPVTALPKIQPRKGLVIPSRRNYFLDPPTENETNGKAEKA